MRIIVFIALFLSCQNKTTTERIPVRAPEPIQVPTPPVITPVGPGVPAPSGFISFASFEDQLIDDLTQIQDTDRIFTVFVPLTAQFIEGAGDMDFYRQGIDKGLNFVSVERELTRLTPVGNQGIYRLDIRDYGITREQWQLITDNDPFAFESFTDRGELIKDLTQFDKPWVHAANFLNIVHNNDVYYDVLEIPALLTDFLANTVGVNLQDEFDNIEEELFLVGLFDSPIALQKNRMLLRAQGRDGIFWSTYDTVVEDQVSRAKNLFENPFPLEAGSARIFQHDAQEFIFTLPNNCSGYALFNAAGLRENFAPLNIVVDVLAGGLDPTIRNSLSCMRCHSQGVLAADDSLRDAVIGNPDFNIDDQQRAQAFFKLNGALQAAFSKDQRDFQSNCLSPLGISASPEDPVNALVDDFRREWDLAQTAAFFFLREAEMAECIESSVTVRAQIGQLIRGENVSLQQMIATAPVIIEDCNLFQDDLGD